MTKSDSIKHELLARFQLLGEHERIPSRAALQIRYRVCRATIDKAINEMIAEGYLYSVKGSGTFVTSLLANPSLKSGVESWGVVVPNIAEDICPVFLRGIEDFASTYSINTIICNTDNNPKRESDHLLRLTASGVSGIIVIPTIIPGTNQSYYKLVREKKIPLIFCSRLIEGKHPFPFIASNDFYGGYLATTHLIKKGYSRIGFISRYYYRTSLDRYLGYRAALAENNLVSCPDYCSFNLPKLNSDLERFYSKLLKMSNSPDAFLCHNDHIAVSLYDVIKEHHSVISDEIGIVGYDNTEICEFLSPKLTSVDFKNYEMGKKAAETLFQLTRNSFNSLEVQVLQPELVVRESCLGKANLESIEYSHAHLFELSFGNIE